MITVQDMEKQDIPAVAILERELFSDAWSERGIQETLQQKDTVCFVAKSDGEIVGYLLVYCMLDECEIARTGVSGPRRRQGVASSMIRKLENFCHSRGISRILLDVRQSNVGAQGFYRHCGFCEDGIRKSFYCNPQEDAVLMSRLLTTGSVSQ